MRSLYDDIVSTLDAHDFSIPNVTVRKPHDGSDKSYPMIVVHELVNVPRPFTTVNGETQTTVGYQLDIHANDCVDDAGDVVSAFDASRRLGIEASDVLDTTYKLTRTFFRVGPQAAPDVVTHIWRGGSVLDSSGYTYRP